MRTTKISLWAYTPQDHSDLQVMLSDAFEGQAQFTRPNAVIYEISGENEERFAGYRRASEAAIDKDHSTLRYVGGMLIETDLSQVDLRLKLAEIVENMPGNHDQGTVTFGNAISMGNGKFEVHEREAQPIAHETAELPQQMAASIF